MAIQGSRKMALDLETLLSELSVDVSEEFAEGSISVHFMSAIEMPLMGRVTISNLEQRISFDSEMGMGNQLLPNELHSLWWGIGAGRDAVFTVSNASDLPAQADVFLDFAGGRHPRAALDFRPRETKVLSITRLLSDLNASPSQAPEGGFSIIPRGTNRLLAQGHISDPTAGFSTTLHFLRPEVQRVSALHASGVPIGTPARESPFAGAGTFIPHVVVRNLIPLQQIVTITLEYPRRKGTGQIALAPIYLQGNQTSDISLESIFGLLPLPLPHCSIRIQYSGMPGSLTAEVSSVEAQGDLVVDSRLANEGDGGAGSGANPWHLNHETSSVLFLTNMGDKVARIGFDVVTLKGHYYLSKLKLDPHETRAIDLGRLRDAQSPDFMGNTIPLGATDGALLWERLDDVPVSGRLVVMQRGRGIATNFDCSPCNCPSSYVQLDIAPYGTDCSAPGITTLNVVANFTLQLTACAKYHVPCTTNYTYSEVTGSASWSSSNTAAATVDNSSRKGLVTGISAGSASITATYADNTYTYNSTTQTCPPTSISRSGSRTVNVQVPTSLSIVAGTDSTTSEASCTTSGGLAGCGVTRTFEYQVNDQSGQPIKVANMAVGDVICNTSTNQLNLQFYKTTCGGTTGSCWGTAGPCGVFTDANGQFTETIPVCAPACKPSGTCTTAGQTVANATWTVAGHTLSSDVKSQSYQCNKILVNGF